MSTDTHTPVPWRLDGDIISGPDGMIAELGFGRRGAGDFNPATRKYENVPGHVDHEMLANAHLMVAAPELLAACKAMMEFEEVDDCSSELSGSWQSTALEKAFNVLRDAIAKAESQ